MEETGLKFPKQGTSGGASPSGSGWAPPAVAETAAPNLQRGRGELQRVVGVHARVHADTPAPTISPVLLVHPCPEPASDPQTYAEAPRLCPITAVVRTGGARLCPARWGAPPRDQMPRSAAHPNPHGHVFHLLSTVAEDAQEHPTAVGMGMAVGASCSPRWLKHLSRRKEGNKAEEGQSRVQRVPCANPGPPQPQLAGPHGAPPS